MKPATTALLAALIGQAVPVFADDIAWGVATNSSSVSDIALTGGGIISAWNGGSGNVLAGGVNFLSNDPLAGGGTTSGLLNGASTGDTGYDALLDSINFGGGSGTSTVTLGSGGLLTSGTSYTLQLWYTDERPTFSGRTMRVGDGATPANTVDLVGNSGSYGQHVTGTFTASGTTQPLTLAPQGFGNAHFNALLLQETNASPPPPPPPPLGPKSTSGWTIGSQAEWTEAYSSGGFTINAGEANPNTGTAVFESRVQLFTEKQSFSSVTFKQNAQWGAAQWDRFTDGRIVQPATGDAGVFVSPAEGDYWYLNATRGGGNYRAYQSSDLVNWTDHGDVTSDDWITSAEYADGVFYVYYDSPNDSDPHLLTFTDLSDASTRTNHGKVFDTPSVTASGSDMAIFRDLDGTFHLIREDWSKINARQHSWDSQVAAHTTSPDGINHFNDTTGPYGIRANLFDEAGNPTGAGVQTYNHPQQGTLSYVPHENEDAWGDYEMLRVGDTYYLFADDDPEGQSIGLGYWYSDDINSPFTYGGRIRTNGHPDPTAGFANGEFFIMTQIEELASDGPWVDAVMGQVGVDTDGDGVADVWTDWQDVSETYGRVDGFAKVFSVDPASIDLSGLPDGYGVQFRFQTDDLAAVMDSIVFESTAAPQLPGDANGDGQVTAADLVILDANFGQPGGFSDSDFNGDGVVTAADLVILDANFGAGVGEASSVSSQSVPEPGSLVALSLSCVLFLRRRR
ncbi:MAG: dockerin type I domain-containing protein [Planctomycetota bacterium]